MMPWQLIEGQVGEIMPKFNISNKTCRYVVGVAALTVLGMTCVIVDGDVGNALGVAVAGAIGYLVKDWRSEGSEDDAKEVPK